MQSRFHHLTPSHWWPRWGQGPARPPGVALASRAGLALLAGLLLLGALETSPRVVVANPGSALQAACFAGFRNYQSKSGARATRPGCQLRLAGLGSGTKVEVLLTLARTALPAGLSIAANGEPATLRLSPDRPHERQLTTSADPAGRIVLTFAHSEVGPPLSLTRVEVRQPGRSWPPWPRLGAYLLALALAGAAAAWSSGRTRAFTGGVIGGTVLLALGLGLDRLTTLTLLPTLLLAGALGLALGLAAMRMGAERRAARFVAAAALVRLALVAQPSFPCIDLGFHSGTLAAFMAGEPIVSRAPNPDRHSAALPMPYPPLAYALLSAPAQAGLARDTLVRLALGLLEGSAPLLVLLLARAGGLSGASAGAAAATTAVMPEGLLVLAKGLLANALGSWLGLAALAAALRRRPLLTAALLAATFLAHFGHALLVLPLVTVWLAASAWRGGLDRPLVLRLAGAVAVALAVAWLTYYREVLGLALATGSAVRDSWTAGPTLHGLRWIQLGKIGQNLLLKFGLLPLGLAWVGWRTAPPGSALRRLLLPWFVVGCAAGLATVVTPVPLRFEYFLVPAVGLAVGLLAEARPEGSAPRWLSRCWLVVFAFQVVLGALLLTDHFRPLAVILESTTWPFAIRF